MSVTGTCELCGERDADWGCDRCGKLVCDEDYDRDAGYCVQCAADLRKPVDRTGDEEEAWRDGVDTHRMD